MAGNYDTTIKVGLEADLSGGMQTEKQLDRLKAKSRELGKEGASAGSQIENSLGKVTKAVGNLRRLMGGFGIVALVMQAVNAFKEWRKSIQEAEDKAKALRDSLKDAADAKAVKEMANAYKEVAERIAEAADERKRSNDLLTEEVRLRREAEDAQTDLEEAQALAASRKREDVIMRMTALDQEARTSASAADELEATLGADRSAIVRARTSSRTFHALSKEMTDRDITWYGARKKTEEGDAVRKDYEQRAEKADAEVEKLEADLKAKEKEIARLRAQAADATARHQLMGTALSTADVASAAADITNGMATASADRSLASRNAQVAADEATLAQGPGRMAAIKRQIAQVEAQKQSAVSADAKEQQDAVLAQQALDSFNSAGHRRNGTGVQAQRSALEADVARETAEAGQSRTQLQSTLATLAATLKGLNADLKMVEREVDAATKRQNANNAEAPAA